MKDNGRSKGKKRARRGALILGLAVILGGWWFLRSDGPAEPAGGVVDVWATWGDRPDDLQQFFDEFTLDETIEVTVSSQIRLEDLRHALEAGEAPDLVILTGAGAVAPLAEEGWVELLDGLNASFEQELQGVFHAALDACLNEDGVLVCLPWGLDVDMLYWNKALFAAAGLDPDRPPETPEELVQYAERLTVRDGEGRLRRVGFIPDFPADHFEPGGWSMDEFAEIYHSDELVDFISSFTPYMSSSHPTSADKRFSCWECHRSTDLGGKKVPYSGFFEGQVAMMVDGSWHAFGGGPGEKPLPENIGALPLGSVALGMGQGHAGLSGPVVVIPTGAADRESALRLVSWMMAPERLAEAAVTNGLLPPTRAAATDARFQRSALVEWLVEFLSGELALDR